MSTILKIKVDKDCFKRSMNCQTHNVTTNCAIAEAVREIFPEASVGLFTVLFISNDPDSASNLPRSAREMIRKFDSSSPEQRLKMEEFEFEVEIPESVVEKISIDKDIEEVFKNSPTMSIIQK